MENAQMQELVRWGIVVFVYIMLAMASDELDSLFGKTRDLVTKPLELLTNAIEDLYEAINSLREPVGEANESFRDAIKDILEKMRSGFESAFSSLQRHIRDVIGQLGDEPDKLGWRIVGAMFCFVAMLAFLYADAAQGANTFSTFFPREEVPPLLQNLVIPLLVASAGTAAVLSMIIGDCIGLTHFIPLEKVPYNWFKPAVMVVTAINFVLTASIAVVMSLSRFVELSVDLSPDTAAQIHNWAALGQSVLLLPLLLTTLLLVWGLAGLIVLYALGVLIVSLLFRFADFATGVLKRAVELGAVGSDIVLKIILTLLFLIPVVIASVLGIIIKVLENLVDGLQAFLKLVLAPPRRLLDVLVKIAEALTGAKIRESIS